MSGFLLPDAPVTDLDAYLASGGGDGLRRALEIGPDATISEIQASGLRGRGGGGFPTGFKWKGLRRDPSATKYVVANGAEGEPGTYKDRALLAANPYQVLEGLQIAAFSVGAQAAYIALKASFGEQVAAVKRALAEMSAAGLTGELPVGVVEGPEDYLFGEEKALLEVIEGNDPLPRLYPPYVQGLFATPADPDPAVVNNVETLANVPHILARGSDWFRGMGTEESPGTMVFTVCGDVRREGVVELEMGTPLSFLVYGIGEGPVSGRSVRSAVSGVSNRPLPASLLDVPMSFEGMRQAGSGLGSGGFVVYDDTACMVRVAAAFSGFLSRESCGQCPPCKLGTAEIRDRFAALDAGGDVDFQELLGWVQRVTDANRCGLGAGQQALAEGFLLHFAEDVAHHLGGGTCPSDRDITVPVITGHHEGRFAYRRAR